MKWKELQYDECSWELESDISTFQPEIERFKRIQSRRRRHSNKLKNIQRDATESHKKLKEFQQYEQSPEFLSGGISQCCFFFFFFLKKSCVSLIFICLSVY